MTNSNLDAIVEIIKLIVSLGFGLGAIIAVILAIQTHKILDVILKFVLNLIKFFFGPPKRPRSKAQQTSKPQQG